MGAGVVGDAGGFEVIPKPYGDGGRDARARQERRRPLVGLALFVESEVCVHRGVDEGSRAVVDVFRRAARRAR